MVAAARPPGTLGGMSKSKKSNSGKHQKKRIGVNFTEDWHAILRQLAAAEKQPVLWWIIDQAKTAADKAGIETPPVPWDDKPSA